MRRRLGIWTILIGEREVMNTVDEAELVLMQNLRETVEQLKETRIKYEISQRTIGEQIGWHQSEVSQMEMMKMKTSRVLSVLPALRKIIDNPDSVPKSPRVRRLRRYTMF